MNLHELDSQVILDEHEKRSDILVDAQDHYDAYKAGHAALESLAYKLGREEKLSIEDSKRQICLDEDVQRSEKRLREAHKALLTAKYAMDRVKLAADLWRTIRADNRKI